MRTCLSILYYSLTLSESHPDNFLSEFFRTNIKQHRKPKNKEKLKEIVSSIYQYGIRGNRDTTGCRLSKWFWGEEGS